MVPIVVCVVCVGRGVHACMCLRVCVTEGWEEHQGSRLTYLVVQLFPQRLAHEAYSRHGSLNVIQVSILLPAGGQGRTGQGRGHGRVTGRKMPGVNYLGWGGGYTA